MTGASNFKILRISSLMLIVMLLCTFTFGKVIYVDDDAAGANDGSSWTDACACLQNALMFAQQGDEIRVAQGIYTPDREIPPGRGGSVVASGDRTATFQLINGVDIKGGYAGYSGPDPNERDISLYETILSGDLNGDDNDVNDPCNLLIEPTRAENSYGVVKGLNVNCLLDGFTISGGNANGSSESGYGGGMNIQLSSVTITNCIFRNNAARGGGGALSSDSGSGPTLNNCIFTRNSGGSIARDSSRGPGLIGSGGMYNNGNSPILTNCTFIENSSLMGGGMYNNDSNLTLTNCTFSGNQALKFGGGMLNSDCNAVLTDCIFTANADKQSGGGGMSNSRSNLTLSNCTFRENFTVNSGGAMSNGSNCNITLIDCLFRGNFANGSGGAMYSYDNNPTLNNCTFSENSSLGSGGGMYNVKANATLTDCTFSRNSAENNGGGIRNTENSDSTLTNCIFSGNKAEKNGGGMYNSNSNPTLTNCAFSGNTAANWGGGINNSNSIVGLTNCTFTGNSAEIGSTLACDSSNQESPSILELINCIIWDGDNEIWNNDDSIIFIEHSDVQGGWSGEGGDNIDIDPLFEDADGADNVIGTEDDDLRLLPDSLCIDAGENSVIPESVVTDVGGNPRIVNDIVDIGAYEFSMEAVPEEIKYGGGSGEPNDPYLIYTAEQMNAIGQHPEYWDKHFKLMADIDLSVPAGDSYHIIGTEDQSFEGIFDGNDHCITNFSFSGDLRIGLFGVADKGARIMNIVLVNPNVRGTKYVGTLVGELVEATVMHCTIQGGTISKPSDSSGQCGFFGGLIGRNVAGTVTSCQAACDIAAERSKYVGGLVGENMGTIQDCSATGTMGDVQTPTEYIVGALVGFNRHDKGIISGCYATGNVYYEDFDAGGLVGMNIGGIFDCYATGNIFYTPINRYSGAGAGGLVGSNCGTIMRCVAMGIISGEQGIGGLVGRNGGGWDKEQFIQSYGSLGFDWGNITDCYATGAVIGTSDLGGLVGENYETVSRCYATGPVSSGEYGVGGCIGMNSQMFEDSTTAGTMIACFWDIETSGQSSSAGGNGVVGRTTAEMQTVDTFLEVDWDFIDETTNGTEDIWWINEGQDYPRLWWEDSDL